MKIIKSTIFFSVLLLIFSCQDPLNVSPLNIIGSDVVWIDKSLVDAYIADLYDRSELIESNDNSNDPYTQRFGAQTLGGESHGRPYDGAYKYTFGDLSEIKSDVALPYFNSTSWRFIRAVNEAIGQLSKEDSKLDVKFREQRLGEVYFLRAHAYFRKVIRYGGVPIIDKVQLTTLPVEVLRVARSTEMETYDFIAKDLDKAISLLAGKSKTISRISEAAAWALKSRAMLYAGSIAKNNDLLPFKDTNGLVGIDPSQGNRYFQLSLEASKKLLPAPFGTGTYKLRPGNTVANYRKIFNNLESTDDTESILTIEFNGETGRFNNEGVYLLPRAMPEHVNWGAWQSVYFETLEWFDYKDGTAGNMLPDGSATLRSKFIPTNFYNLNDLFANKDPRFRGSIALPPYTLQGYPVYFHWGVTSTSFAASAGVPNAGPNQNKQASGMCVIKTADEINSKPINDKGDSPLVVFRLGEIYLNYAEAAFALNDDTGLAALNTIRNRVGMPVRNSLTMENIMNERKVELAFEGHRFWDLRRWRIAVTALSPTQKYKVIRWTWNVEKNTYSATLMDENKLRLFKPEHYYFPIPLDELQNNPVLIQNPGYK
jgi:hypothetical protein